MAKCPNCGADIDYLDYEETKSHSGNLTIVDGKPETSVDWIDSETHYDCPECGEEVAASEEAAVTILKGEF